MCGECEHVRVCGEHERVCGECERVRVYGVSVCVCGVSVSMCVCGGECESGGGLPGWPGNPRPLLSLRESSAGGGPCSSR